MQKLHLFEFEDLPWFPAVIRDAGTGYLELMARLANHGEVVAPVLTRALQPADKDRVVDLCSGGSGPLPSALAFIADHEGRNITATLTDLYPNRNAFERISRDNPAITADFESINATSIPENLKGLRTLFSGLHHFRPAQAKKILGSAVEDRASIAIFEFVARHPLALLGMCFIPLLSLVPVPLLRPFRWSWIALTYLVPIIPFFIFWDGMVSCLRCYSQDELREMTTDLTSDDYQWEIGGLDLPGVPFDGVYAIGAPTPSDSIDRKIPST
jgi:hypothetical protein